MELLGPLVVMLICLFPLASIVWAALDAVERDRSGCLIGILVAITWPFGLIIWLIARPPKAT